MNDQEAARPARAQRGEVALELKGAAKAYGHVVAVDNANLSVKAGEVLGVVGDNGAGKSTMMKMLSGLVRPDHGTLKVFGEEVQLTSPAHAREVGISTVYQDLALVECLDISTNMFLGRLPRKGLFVNRKRMRQDARKILEDVGSRVRNPDALVGDLSGGQRQIVAIARAVRSDAPICLLDEPTAALGVRETAHVAEIIAALREKGKAVICISHDMEFVQQHMDRIVVMRRGVTVADRVVGDTNRDEIVGLITGSIATGGAES